VVVDQEDESAAGWVRGQSVSTRNIKWSGTWGCAATTGGVISPAVNSQPNPAAFGRHETWALSIPDLLLRSQSVSHRSLSGTADWALLTAFFAPVSPVSPLHGGNTLVRDSIPPFPRAQTGDIAATQIKLPYRCDPPVMSRT
jgi:hypothetical protein